MKALLVAMLALSSVAQASNFALIVNGDPDDPCHTHTENASMAREALTRQGFLVDVVTTRAQVEQALRKAVRSGIVNSESLMVIYTTGHGDPRGRLITEGGWVTTLSGPWLVNRLRSVPYTKVFYIGDQCYSVPMAKALAALPRSHTLGANVAMGRCEKFARTRWRAFAEDGDLDKLVAANTANTNNGLRTLTLGSW